MWTIIGHWFDVTGRGYKKLIQPSPRFGRTDDVQGVCEGVCPRYYSILRSRWKANVPILLKPETISWNFENAWPGTNIWYKYELLQRLDNEQIEESDFGIQGIERVVVEF